MNTALRTERASDSTGKVSPASDRSAATRARILQAAHRQFVANGLEGTRMEAIAAEAGVNKSLVYRHFGNRENLYREILHRAYERIRSAEGRLRLDDDPLVAVDRIVSFTLRYAIENPDFLVLVGIENLNRGEQLKEINRERLQIPGLIGMLASVIRRGTEAGLFRDGLDPSEIYTVICSQCWFTVSTQYTFGFTFEVDVMAKANLMRREALIQDNVRRWMLRDPDDVPATRISNSRALSSDDRR
jgi:TetR/AcrR family transcriptional regulator